MPENNSTLVSHFFTIPSLISQTPQQAFGPQSTEVYNISSRFTVSADSMAFAICKSAVLVQPNKESTDKVNLILRPYNQPIKGVNIKYFIYRGLKKNDFFNGNEVLGAGSGFITKIRSDFESFYATDSINTNPPFLSKYIGFDPENQPDNLLLDDFFFKESKYVESNGEFQEDPSEFGNFELPLVDIGTSLGHFVTGECAIDVVLNYGDYKPTGEISECLLDMTYARSMGQTITVGTEDTFEDKQKREQVFQFLDIAAFYGWYTANGSVTVDNSGTKQNLTGQAIYTNTLNGFYTKNKLYLYIQGDRTRSYNFYGNYKIDETENSLKWGTEAGVLTERAYKTLGWPVIIESPTTESVYVQFVTDNNVNTVLYGQIATIKGTKNNFANADDLLLPADENGVLGKFTKTLELANPVVGTNSPVIANFNILIYQGILYKYNEDGTLETIPQAESVSIKGKPYNDYFNLFNGQLSLFSKAENADFLKITFKKMSLINYYDVKQIGIAAIQVLIVQDTIETPTTLIPRITYLTESIEVMTTVVSALETLTADTTTQASSYGSIINTNTFNLPAPYYYEIRLFTDMAETITGLLLKTDDKSLPSKFIIGLTNIENELLQNIVISVPQLKNARMLLFEISTESEKFYSPEGIDFKKYKLGLTVENNGTLELHFPTQDINLYTIDKHYYFSKGYSDYMPQFELTKETNLTFSSITV